MALVVDADMVNTGDSVSTVGDLVGEAKFEVPDLSDELKFLARVEEYMQSAGIHTANDGSARTPSTEKKHKTKSLLQMTQKGILNSLKQAVNEPRVTSRYCCEGLVNNEPVVLRVNSPQNKNVSMKLKFPPDQDATDGLFLHSIAGTSDRVQFSTDFDPQSIVNIITQVLLPSTKNDILCNRYPHRGVKAVLSKLHVVSSGQTADLTSSNEQRAFGSLIICLPYAHAGGLIEISCGDHTSQTGDGKFSGGKLGRGRWTAYLDDCEINMRTVLSGVKVLLQYRLFVSEQIGQPLRNEPIFDPKSIPLYPVVKEILETPGFMKTGGKLGFYCRYNYFHTNPVSARLIPNALKGVDLVIYKIFILLGCNVSIRPVLPENIFEDQEETSYEIDEDCYEEETGMHVYSEHSSGKDEPNHISPTCLYCGSRHFISFEEWLKFKRVVRAGTKLHDLRVCETNEEAWHIDERACILNMVWPYDEMRNVEWLNTPNGTPGTGGGWETAVLNVDFMDEVDTTRYYSHLVIFVDVPRMLDRDIAV